MNTSRLIACSAWVLAAVAVAGAASDPTVRPPSTWPPKGTAVKVPVTRDVWISDSGREQRGNNGAAPKWKLKGLQEFTLFDADLKALRGKRITGALLHFRCLTPAIPARRVSVSTVAAPWVEGTGASYTEQNGSACVISPALGERDWAYPGSTVLDVAWGKGRTIWRFADATPPDAKGWQAVAVEPDVVAANVAGLSHGFAVMDDVGTEWSQKGGKFADAVYPNRFFASREQRGSEPWLEVWTDGSDSAPPAAVAGVEVDAAILPAGQAVVRWKTPADAGGGRVLGYNVTCSRAGQPAAAVPRYLVPMAGDAGEEVRLVLQDLGLKSGEAVKLSIVAVDAAGNAGPACAAQVTVSSRPASVAIAPSGIAPFEPSETLPSVGGLKVAVIDLLDKIEARTGRMVPEQPAGYKGGNHIWSGGRKLVRLQAGRNETVAFQINLEGQSPEVKLTLTFAADAGVQASLGRFDCVSTAAGVMPDAVVPLAGAVAIPATDDPQAADQSNASFLAEVYVPHAAAPGPKRGTLTIAAGGATLALDVDLAVWDFTLPDKLSFVPEMNCYGTAGPTGAGLAFYRVAHRHRTSLNCLNYGWNGSVRGGAPEFKDGGFDWSRFDREWGPLFDGSAFADLPRKGQPLDFWYLPFNEEWPVSVAPHYKANYWADEAMDDAYRQKFRAACAEFARHVDQRKWHDTVFEFYLNNKVYYRRNRSIATTQANWIFDEPANTQDYWALRWYGLLFHQGVGPARGGAKLWYRADVSRTQFDRDMFWGLLDLEVMGGTTPQKIRMKRDEQSLWSHTHRTEYGGANHPSDPNTQPAVWSLLAWTRGCIGVLPWQTIGTASAWEKGEDTCLFYPPRGGEPAPSVRLKAFTRGQQDIEYLTLLADAYGLPDEAVATGLRQVVDLTGQVRKTSEDDAGTIRFTKADPAALWELRTRVGAMVAAKHPAFKRSLRELATPATDLTHLPPIGCVTVAPPVPVAGPEM